MRQTGVGPTDSRLVPSATGTGHPLGRFGLRQPTLLPVPHAGLAVLDLVLPPQGVLAGKDEAEAFERGEYAAVKRSTLGKVRLMLDILQLAHDRTLNTNATWWDLNVGRVREAYEMFERNPVQAVAGTAVTFGGEVFGLVMKFLG